MPSYHYTNFDDEVVTVEITEEVDAFLKADDKRVQREERQAKRYCKHFQLYSWNNFNLLSVSSCEEDYINEVEEFAKEQQDQETVQKIFEVLDTCTSKQKERFLLYAVEGLTQREISEKLCCGLASVNQSLQQVKNKLKTIVNI